MKVIHKISGAGFIISLFVGWGIAGNIDCGGTGLGRLVWATLVAMVFGVGYILTLEDKQ